MPDGMSSGTPVIQHGHFGRADGDGGRGTALVVECGQHFLRASGEVAVSAAQAFLAHFGLIEQPPVVAAPAPNRFELLHIHVVKTTDFSFVRPCIGFEVFAKDELIATDGELEVRAPCDECTVLMPARTAIVGREGVYLARPIH